MGERKSKPVLYLNRAGGILVAAIIAAACPFFLARIWGCSLYGIVTESMEPAYRVNGVVIVKKWRVEELTEGDVIAYALGEKGGVLSHRIVGVGEDTFITKGDANEGPDPEPVKKDRVLGKVIGFVPDAYPWVEALTSKWGRMGLAGAFALALLCWTGSALLERRGNRGENRNGNISRLDPKRIFLRLTGFLLIGGALWYLWSILGGYRASEREYAALRQEILPEAGQQAATSAHPLLSSEEGIEDGVLLYGREVCERVAAYGLEYPDMKGWLLMEGGSVSYPIMQGKDNEEYLDHTYSGEHNRGGSIFLEARNLPDFSQSHTIVYGHNMKDGSMFGGLKRYREEQYCRENPYFMVYTADKILVYQVFSCYETAADSQIYQVISEGEGLEVLMKSMQESSWYDTGIAVGSASRILTLSTCAAGEKRWVVHGALITEYLLR